ncbi:membrane protein insertase YidC [Lacisediminimonas sp.]|uniref:membrane protein insertase YidC n=1 Tax=Lacisediminimonas sp. TaxID=3060582 RepID=UPI002717D3A7|nr:membrane protein insertase YidC [Lacisediminimonas sp.]MDO8300649.1 membrane protein insertase YidC [Lacisediminimonas sp.]
MDIQRTVLWVVFSMSLLILWDNWMRYNGKPSLFFPTPVTQQAADKPKQAADPKADVPQASSVAPAGQAQLPPGAAAPAPAAVAAAAEKITITTDLMKVDIDSIGGEIRRLELLKHKDANDTSKNVVLFDSSPTRTYLGQTGLIGGAYPNHRTPFAVRPGTRQLGSADQLQLVLEAEQGGVKLTKTYTFKRGDYVIGVRHDVQNQGTAAVSPSLYLQLVRDGGKLEGESHFYSTFTGPAVYTDVNKFEKLDFDTIAKGKSEHATKADDGWIAMIQHYFVSAFVPSEKTPREYFTKKIDNNLYSIGTIVPVGTVAPGATAAVDSQLYSGPQETERLEKIAPGLDLVKDYGWLTIVAKPIFWLMMQIQKYLHNWGWTIVALTILIKLAFFPLSAASYRSMAKMKTVTPRMTEIRERHKGDPQKMNQAMMELYKTEKINPLGGCLPIVVQIPVFIALYWVLLASVEMRNAPWIWWIKDLATPDPFYILPVVMAVSMFVQTKLNPTPPDPMQAKVMLFMPIIFSVMFFFFPSGLVLYWVVNNLLSIAQQWVITKNIERSAAARA